MIRQLNRGALILDVRKGRFHDGLLSDTRPASWARTPRSPSTRWGTPARSSMRWPWRWCNTIKAHNAAGKKTVFICPVGPVGQYPIFVRLVNRDKHKPEELLVHQHGRVPQRRRDQWIDKESPLSFRGFMDRHGVHQGRPGAAHARGAARLPRPRTTPARLTGLIEELGGVDIAFGGIGINGHLAFNEAQPELTPEQFAQLRHPGAAHLTPETKTANCHRRPGRRHGSPCPTRRVTIGIKQILGARKVRLGVFRDWHRGRGAPGGLRRGHRRLPRHPAPEPPGRRASMPTPSAARPALLRGTPWEKNCYLPAAASMWTAVFSRRTCSVRGRPDRRYRPAELTARACGSRTWAAADAWCCPAFWTCTLTGETGWT